MKKPMSEEEKKEQKKLKQLMLDIKTGDQEKITGALKSLRVHGNSSVLPLLLETWQRGVTDKNENEIIEFLSELKHSDSVYPIMNVLNDGKFEEIHQKLLTTIWNTNIDYSEHLEDFVKIAVKGDFMVALECLTIIENLEGPFEEQQFLEAQIELSEYAGVQNKNTQKEQIMSELAKTLKKLEREIIG